MNSRRYVALDGLRGVAAFFVIFHHIRWSNHTIGLTAVHNGYLAVDLFFILSGFVIAASYADRIDDAASARDFLLLRIFRVYPLHVFVLTGLVCLEGAKFLVAGGLVKEPPFEGVNSLGALVANLFLVHSWGLLDRLSWNLPSWSISAEFGAYIVFAVVVASGFSKKRGFWSVFAALSAAGYAALAISRGTLDLTYDLGLVRCLCGFTLGVWLNRRLGLSVSGAPALGVPRFADLAAGVVLVVALSLLSGAASFVVVAMMVALIACLADDEGLLARTLQTRPFQYLGAISYSIYMVHVPIRTVLMNVLERQGFHYEGRDLTMDVWLGDAITVGYLAIVLIVGSITYFLVEEPGRKLGRRLVGKGRRSPAVTAS